MANITIKDVSGKLAMTDVGKRYHLALGIGQNMYGYNLTRKESGGGEWHEKADAKTRDTISSVGSPNVSDRDLQPIPRVTDGNFSGGALQQLFIDPKMFYDSDLEIRVPGNLTLRAAWTRFDLGPRAGAVFNQGGAVAYNNDVYISFAETSKNIYSGANGNSVAPYLTYWMDTDGAWLWGGDQSGNLWKSQGNGAFTSYAASLPVGVQQMWAVFLGNNGTFLYLLIPGLLEDTLYRVPITLAGAPGAAVQVPLGYNPTHVVDLVPYGGGIAILMQDSLGSAMSVWFHDGTNLSLMMRLKGYRGLGICDCLGELYVTAVSYGSVTPPSGNLEPPILLRVSQGSFDIVARIGSQINSARVPPYVGPPISSGQYVAFIVGQSLIAGVSQQPAIWVYDVLSGAISHLGNLDATDFAIPPTNIRQMTYLGRAIVGMMQYNPGGGVHNFVQYQTSQQAWPPGFVPIIFANFGQLVTSLFDFNTPGLTKQFRRVLVSHTALKVGESVTVSLFVDRDPQLYLTGVTTPDATVTHAYSGGDPVPSKTVLNVPQHTIGYGAFIVVQVHAGTNQTTSPTVFWLSTEIAPPYTYNFDLDCTRDIRSLDGHDDPLQLSAKDRVGMLRNAYENGQPLTLWTDFGESKQVNIADYDWRRASPMNQGDSEHRADTEGYVSLVLTETVI